MNNLWSAVAPDWSTGLDTIALVTGILNGVISADGCVMGGWIADRVGRWWSYFGSGIAIALVAMVMAVVPRTPSSFTGGVLVYAPFLRDGLRRLFRGDTLGNRPRCGFHQIRHPFFAWKYPGRLHDRFGRLGPRPLQHGLDAARRSPVRHRLHLVRAFLFLERSTLLKYGPIYGSRSLLP